MIEEFLKAWDIWIFNCFKIKFLFIYYETFFYDI